MHWTLNPFYLYLKVLLIYAPVFIAALCEYFFSLIPLLHISCSWLLLFVVGPWFHLVKSKQVVGSMACFNLLINQQKPRCHVSNNSVFRLVNVCIGAHYLLFRLFLTIFLASLAVSRLGRWRGVGAVLRVGRRGSTPSGLLRWLRWLFAPLFVFPFVMCMCSSRALLFFRDLSRVSWLIHSDFGLLMLLASGPWWSRWSGCRRRPCSTMPHPCSITL